MGAFEHYLRTGERLTSAEWKAKYARKFNPNHDPSNGQFIFGGGLSARSENQSTVEQIRATRQNRGDHTVPQNPSSVRRALSQADVTRTNVTTNHIRTIMPHAGDKADTFLPAINIAMETHSVVTQPQQAAFLAQVSVESGDLRNTEENLNYSAKRLMQVWPRRFPTLTAAEPYAHNPEALARHVYADRLSNGNEASGDGWRFRGRGLMQITGRANYRAIGLEANPDSLTQPKVAAASAAQFWSNNGLTEATRVQLNREHFNAISRRVNGGDHGIDLRWQAYQRALTALRTP